MGNSIIVKRIKGITQYYAKDHIREYKKGDFLRIVPDFNNSYDHNALAIYDDHNHKLGFIDKYSNVTVYQTIKDTDYICIITSVYTDYSKPSIEFQIIYRTKGSKFEISEDTFNDYFARYNHNNSSLPVLCDNKEKDKIAVQDKRTKQIVKKNIKKDKYIVLSFLNYYSFLEELKKFNLKVMYLYHKKFGIGKVIFVSKDFITLKFESVGDKTFKFPESINVHLFKIDS